MKLLAALTSACALLVPLATAQDTYLARSKAAQAAIVAKRSEGPEAFYAELEKQARELLRDFPDKRDPYELMLAVARRADPAKARAILNELNTPKAPAEVREQAQSTLARLDAVGKPVDIKFKATDGRQVDLTAMKGKVVLVDFWATWCGPCVQEIPNVVAAFEKLHPKGFEIVGISFDKDNGKLDQFVKAKKMPWPQYFDGKGWENVIGRKYGISSIPAMWLIGKDGNLADLNAREDLEGKVERLLAK